MSDLVAIAFPTEAKAEEIRQKLVAMQKEHLIDLGDVVIAAKDSNGYIKLNRMIDTTTADAVSSTFWGALIDDKWMKKTAAAIEPGTATLVALVRNFTTDRVLDGLRGDGGTVLKTSLEHTKEAALQAALAGLQALISASPPDLPKPFSASTTESAAFSGHSSGH
jgi:uncharacterized membrane protein